MKSPFESQPDIKLGFLCAGRERERAGERDREEVRGTDRGEVWSTGSEPAPRMQQVDMQRRARPSSPWHSESRKQIARRTRARNLSKGGQSANVESHTDTHNEQVIRRPTAAKVGEAAAQKSVRQQLILPV